MDPFCFLAALRAARRAHSPGIGVKVRIRGNEELGQRPSVIIDTLVDVLFGDTLVVRRHLPVSVHSIQDIEIVPENGEDTSVSFAM